MGARASWLVLQIKNPRESEGFLFFLGLDAQAYFLRRHLANAPPMLSRPKTATEVGSGTAPPELWVNTMSKFVPPLRLFDGPFTPGVEFE